MAYAMLRSAVFDEKQQSALEDWLYAPDPADLAEFDAFLAEALALPDDDEDEVSL